jgi:hypothetical protein
MATQEYSRDMRPFCAKLCEASMRRKVPRKRHASVRFDIRKKR